MAINRTNHAGTHPHGQDPLDSDYPFCHNWVYALIHESQVPSMANRDIRERRWLRDPMKLISLLDGVYLLVLIKKLSY